MAPAGTVTNALELKGFDWKDGFAFIQKDSAKFKTAEKSEKPVAAEQNEVATTILLVIWLGKLQGERDTKRHTIEWMQY